MRRPAMFNIIFIIVVLFCSIGISAPVFVRSLSQIDAALSRDSLNHGSVEPQVIVWNAKNFASIEEARMVYDALNFSLAADIWFYPDGTTEQYLNHKVKVYFVIAKDRINPTNRVQLFSSWLANRLNKAEIEDIQVLSTTDFNNHPELAPLEMTIRNLSQVATAHKVKQFGGWMRTPERLRLAMTKLTSGLRIVRRPQEGGTDTCSETFLE